MDYFAHNYYASIETLDLVDAYGDGHTFSTREEVYAPAIFNYPLVRVSKTNRWDEADEDAEKRFFDHEFQFLLLR